MKIYYMSDLHKDINGDYIEKLEIPDDAEESILLLAGDLHSKGR
ncbi:metallophosphoesterase [Pseudaeromonas phage vB_PpeM_ KLEP7]|nr:metallophosphoesterase [Pseudaeromonas phage vB_PpeM_ KLEP7]